MIKKYVACALFLTTLSPSFTMIAEEQKQQVEVRKINPPRLDAENIGKKVLCHRPLRMGGPKLAVEERFGKVIASSYGHSGSGWTLGPGSIMFVIGDLDKKMAEKKMDKDEPIVICGAGVMGLMSAMELKQLGYKNIRIIAENFEGLTSHNAGGQFAPVFMGNDPSVQPLMDKIGVDSYNYYKAIIQGKHPYLKRGATLVTDYFENKEDFGLEPYVKAGAMQPAKDVILDFQNGTTRKMFAYDDCIYMDVSVLMHDLQEAVKAQGVPFEKKKINSFEELPEKIIVNCTGLGSKKLLNDDKLISVQGHLVMLKDQKPEDVNYMVEIYLGKGKTSTGLENTRAFYIFPKHLPDSGVNDIGVLGGSYIKFADPSCPHEEEFDIVVENAKKFYGLK